MRIILINPIKAEKSLVTLCYKVQKVQIAKVITFRYNRRYQEDKQNGKKPKCKNLTKRDFTK